MNLSAQTLFTAARDTLANPAQAARQVMGLGLSTAEGMMAVAATAIAATLLTALMRAFFGPVADPAMEAIFSRPFVLAASQFSLMTLGAYLMFRVGRAFGGTGDFAKALSLVAWLEIVLILLQVAQVLVLLILPILALPVALASIFIFFYLVTHFTAALNGYSSVIKTFFGILATLVVILLAISLLTVLLLPVPNA